VPRVGPCPRVWVSLLGVYTSVCPIFENLDAELSGKRIIHTAKELRFPHFFEGCVLRESELVCVCVGNFPLELNNTGLENKYRASCLHFTSPWHWAGPMGLTVSGSKCVIIHTYFWLESAMFLFFFFFVIILLFRWKLHTGINRSSRSSLGHHPGLQNEAVEEKSLGVGALG